MASCQRSLRRSCTSELVRANANLYHVSRLLGHESLDTLRHYVRLHISDLRETHQHTHPRELDERDRFLTTKDTKSTKVRGQPG